MSLKSELLGETLPEFTVALPDGWVRKTPDAQTKEQMLDAARARLMALHRPDLYAQVMGMVAKTFAAMQRVETVAFFQPAEGAPDAAWLPATMTASIRRGPNGTSLDDTVASLIRLEGATSLDADKRFLRWQKQSLEELEGTKVATTTVVYFTPIPGTGRTSALQFTVVITHDPAADGDEAFVEGLTSLFDALVSTFAWVAPR